ncbi:hypothetical protein KWI08_06440 [Morganella morganii]|uniref:hypothetical protein n=1 Tax=Morganella morganii TaxID=582 RepID=UPI0021CFBA7A|nr:hypothetical protein [Morganella morganii]MCU6273537.1 hypothetical protein [Morganella morganii]
MVANDESRYENISVNEDHFIAKYINSFQFNKEKSQPKLLSDLVDSLSIDININCDKYNDEIEPYKNKITYSLFLFLINMDNTIRDIKMTLKYNDYLNHKQGLRSLSTYSMERDDVEKDRLLLIDKLSKIGNYIRKEEISINT